MYIRQRYPVKSNLYTDGTTVYKGGMTTVLNIRIDPRLKKAMERIAQEQSITLSDAIRIAMVKYLKEQGIDWREEEYPRSYS